MKYTDAKKSEWLKTIRNYLISKAVEIKHYLPAMGRELPEQRHH